MKAPSIKALQEAFRDLTREQAQQIRKLAKTVHNREEFEALEEELGIRRADYTLNSGNLRRERMMQAIDRILGTHGVEPLGEVDMHDGPPYAYCNTGDPYVWTVIYDRKRDRLILGSWGDIAEKM